MNNSLENEWKIKFEGDHYDLSQFEKRFENFLQFGIYNTTVKFRICKICGQPKVSNLVEKH